MLFRKHIFSDEEKKQIVAAIAKAEAETSGEIRVHIEPKCRINAVNRATEVFHKLGMQNTAKRNGVLIYLAYTDKLFAIIGDKGIHELVPDHFWDSTKNAMSSYFKEGKFHTGVIHGIEESAKQLAKYFPHESNDINELSNEISEG